MVSVVHLLALATAIAWGFQPIPARRGLAVGGNPLQATVVGAGVSTTIAWTALAVTAGPGPLVAALPAFAIGIFVVDGMIGNSIARLWFNVGVERIGASITTAASNTYPLFASVFALVLIAEPITLPESVGMVVITAGLVVLSLSRGGNVRGWQLSDLAFPIAAAIAWGLGSVLVRFGLTVTATTPLQATAITLTAGFGALVGYVIARKRYDTFRVARRSYLYFAFASVFGVTGFLLYFRALDIGRVVVVAPLAATSPLFTTGFTRGLLGDLERVTAGVVIGTALIVGGVAVMTLL